MTKINKDVRVLIKYDGHKKVFADNSTGKTIKDVSPDTFIYMMNVNFKQDGVIQGRFKGEASDFLLHSKANRMNYVPDSGVWVKDSQSLSEGRKMATAKMVVVKGHETYVVID